MKTNPLEESLQSSQRDVGLIRDDVLRKDFSAAIHGFDTVINDLQEMRDNLAKAWQSHCDISKQLGLDPKTVCAELP